MIKVSVIIPVWNALDCIDHAVASVLDQSMSAEDIELICVDDGSTDGSLDRLRVLEREHATMTVISIPPSGWAGRPRNVGTEAAAGEYVMYLDQDDLLDPEALERMYVLGSANGADVVLGKVTSDFRSVHHYLYRAQRPRCSVYDAPLINSQTPHKMLRRAFLSENQIRYPEGRRRLEDQLFMTKAYFCAETCSIVADYVCYRYLERPSGDNTSRQSVDTWAYFDYLRDVLDVVDEHTEPGTERDHFYRRFLRVEMLNKLAGGHVLRTPSGQGDRWLMPVRRLAEERFPTSVDEGLPVISRYRAHLMRRGTFADLQTLVAGTRRIQPNVTAELSEVAGGVARLDIEGAFAVDGSPLLLESGPDGSWLMPVSITGPAAGVDHRRVGTPADMVADLVIVDRDRGDEWFVDRSLEISIEPDGVHARLLIRGTVTLDTHSAAGGRPLPFGRHDLSIRIDALGLNRLRPLRVSVGSLGSNTVAVLGAEPWTIVQITKTGKMFLRVGVSAKSVRAQLNPARVTWDRGRMVVSLATRWPPSTELRADLTSRRAGRISVPLSPVPGSSLDWRSSAATLPPGHYLVRLQLPGVGGVELESIFVVPWSAKSAAQSAVRRIQLIWHRFRGRR